MNMKAGPAPRSSTLSVSGPIFTLGKASLALSECAALFAAGHDLGHIDGAFLAGALHAGLDDRQIARRPIAVRLRLGAGAHAMGKLLQLLPNGVVACRWNGARRRLPPPQVPQPREQI